MKYGCLNIFAKWKDKFKVGSRVYFICVWLSVCLPEEITTPLQGPPQNFRSPCHSVCFLFPPSSNIFNEFAHPDLPLCLPAHLVVFRFSLPPCLSCSRWDSSLLSWLPFGKQSIQRWRAIQLRLIEKLSPSGAPQRFRLPSVWQPSVEHC